MIGMIPLGCAQIGAPTGGPRDTIAPILVKALPNNYSTNIEPRKIVLSFDEYIELQELSNNLIISPLPKSSPQIQSNLKNISISFKDSLEPNTTYTLAFGNAIKDINEGNVLKDFQYTFSTGNQIDSLTLKGKVILAETGKIDTTLVMMLYKDAVDSSVKTRKPNYITKLKGDGSFIFTNLPNSAFKVYALKDGDGNKYYNSPTEMFGFVGESVTPSIQPEPLSILAYAEKKQEASPGNQSNKSDKKDKIKFIKYGTNLMNGKQDLLKPFELDLSSSLTLFDKDSLLVCDTSWKLVKDVKTELDSSRKKITINKKWIPGERINVLLFKKGFSDSTGLTFFKSDTIKIWVKEKEEYGTLKLTFQGLDMQRKPVLQLMDGITVLRAFPLTQPSFTENLMLPGDYEFSVLYDENGNGKWDAGNYEQKKQPEETIAIPQKVNVRADWENERTLIL
jgi:hypothetical protein